jgi:hypothetical protein
LEKRGGQKPDLLLPLFPKFAVPNV